MTDPARWGGVVYPESDGEPMADNDAQRDLMETIELGLADLFADQQVYVSANIFWYPIEGKPQVVQAPDLLVVFGRPPGTRGTYKQWLEEGIAPQFVAEIASPTNTWSDLVKKRRWYDEHGVQELLEYDPATAVLDVHVRAGDQLVPVIHGGRWTSPLLGVTFWPSADAKPSDRGPVFDLFAAPADGPPFTPARELTAERDRYRAERDAAAAERDAATAERDVLLARLRDAGLEP